MPEHVKTSFSLCHCTRLSLSLQKIHRKTFVVSDRQGVRRTKEKVKSKIKTVMEGLIIALTLPLLGTMTGAAFVFS